jgi:ligand-binding SRPBCC domain-containing protein
MRIVVDTWIAASPEACFDASRDIDLHTRSVAHTDERAIGGRRSGLIELGEEVAWEGVHFGLRLRHRSRITAFDRPRYFQDAMVKGHFRSFVHDHLYTAERGGTLMRDVLEFASPYGPLGALVDRLVLGRYLRRFLKTRAEVLRTELERGARV